MKERPILFSGSMVRAILGGRKTQTRRVVKVPPWLVKMSPSLLCAFPDKALGITPCLQVPCADNSVQRLRNPWMFPEPEPSRLWVRETFWPRPFRTPRDMREGADTWPRVFYDADAPDAEELRGWGWKRKPTIFMPRDLSRIVLQITNVRAERLCEISEQDARKEGMLTTGIGARASFMIGWDTINGKRKGCTWSDNPWVWVIEFQREVEHG